MKKQAAAILNDVTGKSYRLTSKTISFSDLARGSAVFVTIHGWDNGANFIDELKSLAHKAGFIFQFEK
jgi:hypothetical protein